MNLKYEILDLLKDDSVAVSAYERNVRQFSK